MEFFAAYVLASVVRGMAVGAGRAARVAAVRRRSGRHPLWTVAFAFAGSAVLGTLGIIAGIWAEKFDQVAAFQNFLIMPLTSFRACSISIHSLPAFWQRLSRFNPFFYMIDGFRYGFFGVSDVNPLASLRSSPCFWRVSRRYARGAKRVINYATRRSDHGYTGGRQELHRARPHVRPRRVVGDGQHFEALIVGSAFRGKSRVQRHQLVYAALGERMREEVHALSMQTLTPEDGRQKQGRDADSGGD